MKRQPANLSESLCHRLNSYAIAASAAGVGVLASSAEAEVVYTPANIKIERSVPLKLSLYNDGINDFYFYVHTFSGNGTVKSYLHVSGLTGNDVVEQFDGSDNLGVADLKAGKTIGPDDRFSFSGTMAEGCHQSKSCDFDGLWANNGKGVKRRYLGVRFKVVGLIHYGWARLSVNVDREVVARLTGYAYETIPNKAIISGKTRGRDLVTVQEGDLGTLAAGSRRK